MRAKMKLTEVKRTGYGEDLQFSAVCRNDGYPVDGRDENNTFAKFTPCANLTMTINNPDLLGKFNPGEEFYLDFTKVIR